MVNKVAELEAELKRIREDSDIWELLSEHRLPYGHEQHLRSIVTALGEKTPYIEVMETIVASGADVVGKSKPAIPAPLRLVDMASEDWRKRYVQTSCSCLSQAAELHALGLRSTPEVRPLLLADSCRLLLAFLVRSITYLDQVPTDLGISIETEGDDPTAIELEISPDGFLATTSIALAAVERPSAFTPVIPDLETYKDDRWEPYPQRSGLSLDKPVITKLADLVEYDFETDARLQTMKWMIEEFHSRYVSTSSLLRDVVLMAAAAELARREPATWREVLRGEVTDLGRHVDRAQAGLRDAVRTVAEVLVAAEAGVKSAYVATGYHFV
jgi:hypothetical protein